MSLFIERLINGLADGSIRLLRGAWLADADASGAVLLRRQELPPEAFVTCAEAVEMLPKKRKKRIFTTTMFKK